MKITKVKSFASADGYFFVKVETDAGIYGVGEGGLRRRALALAEVVRSFEPFLIGEDPFRIEHLWQVMFRGGFFPRRGRPICRSQCRRHRTLGHQRKSIERPRL